MILEKQIAANVVRRLFNPAAGWPEHEYTPYGTAVEVYHSTDPELLVSGPAGTGKSRAILEKIHDLALHYPRIRALIVRKTRESLSESTLVTFEDEVLGEDHPLLLGKGGKVLERSNRTHYLYPNRSRIVLGGMDKPRKVLSSQYDIIYVPEAIELMIEDWEALATRNRNYKMPWQQLIGDTNPGPPTHWLKMRCDAGLTKIIHSRHEDNPCYFDQTTGEWTTEGKLYVFGTLDRLTGVRRKWFREGQWVAAEGIVLETWDESIHLINRFAIPPEWRRIVSIDFGYRNPFVAQWWAIDMAKDRMYRYREIYMTGRIVQDHAQAILRYSEGEKIEAFISDHDAEDRATLARYGVRTIPAKKSIKTGIDAIESRLRMDDDGKPRLFYLRDSVMEIDQTLRDAKLPYCTEQEIPGYIWSPSQTGKVVKEVPVDKDNHGIDATRYAVMYVDGDNAGPPARRFKVKGI